MGAGVFTQDARTMIDLSVMNGGNEFVEGSRILGAVRGFWDTDCERMMRDVTTSVVKVL